MLRPKLHCRLFLAFGCACFWETSPIAAQSTSSMFGASSMSSRSTSGSTSLSGGSTSGSMGNAFGSSGMGNLANMMGGQSGGMNGMNNGMMGNNRGATGMGNQGNFVGRNTNPNQFIGSNQMTGANTGQLNNRPSQGNRNSTNNPNGTQNPAANQPPALRARQKIGFDFPKPQGEKLQSQVQTRFAKLTRRNASMKGITFSLDDTGAVVLQGGVPSESAAKLAEKLVRLEPGVKAVRSELTYPTANAE
ncbi:MAG TPA: BON domain-containing protein [Planctomycetaceae bacterium]|nr:BON domain-containing protein [Planctomycetaceae bacterium]